MDRYQDMNQNFWVDVKKMHDPKTGCSFIIERKISVFRSEHTGAEYYKLAVKKAKRVNGGKIADFTEDFKDIDDQNDDLQSDDD